MSLHCCLSLCPKGILSNKISASSNWIDLIWFQVSCPQSDFILRFNIRKIWIEKIGPLKLFVVPGLLCNFGWEVTMKIHYSTVSGGVTPNTYIHTYIHTYMHACIHTYIHTYIYILFIYIYNYIYIYSPRFAWGGRPHRRFISVRERG